MSAILRRELINKTALIAGSAAGTLLGKCDLRSSSSSRWIKHDGCATVFASLTHSTPIIRRPTVRTRWVVHGWLSRALDVRRDLSPHRWHDTPRQGEIHAGWVLEGRAPGSLDRAGAGRAARRPTRSGRFLANDAARL